MSDASGSMPARRRLVVFLLVALPVLVWARARGTWNTGTPGLLLAYLSEGAFAMLLGIALGVATSFLARFLLFGVLLWLVVAQYIAYLGLDPLFGIELFLRDHVWNIQDGAVGGAIVRHKLPTLACCLLGYGIGRRR